MYSSRFLRTRNLALFVMVFIFASAVYGFAAANTMPDDTASGYGAVGISGYTITDIRFSLNTGGGPPTISTVALDVTAPASAEPANTVLVSLDNDVSWYSCTLSSGVRWTCDVSAGNYTVQSRTNLAVVASQ